MRNSTQNTFNTEKTSTRKRRKGIARPSNPHATTTSSFAITTTFELESKSSFPSIEDYRNVEDMFSYYLLSLEIITPEIIVDDIHHDLSYETTNNRDALQLFRVGLHNEARDMTEHQLLNNESSNEAVRLFVK